MRKINEIENRNIENTQVIIRQIASDKQINDIIYKANISSYNSQIIYEINTDFQFLSMYYGKNYEDGDLQRQYIRFETTFEKFDEKVIPFISIVPIFIQFGVNYPSVYDEAYDGAWYYNIQDSLATHRNRDLSSRRYSNTFEVEDIFGSNLKQVKVITAFSFQNGYTLIPQLKAKLLVSVYNPTDFSRIN